MSQDPANYVPEQGVESEHDTIFGFVRWWHWLVVVGLCLAGFVYYPKWHFEQQWNQIQVGDPLEKVQTLLGHVAKPSYSVQGAGATPDSQAYIYTRYGRTYEILISSSTQRVSAKNVLGVKPAPQ